jgi:hypothetical protein
MMSDQKSSSRAFHQVVHSPGARRFGRLARHVLDVLARHFNVEEIHGMLPQNPRGGTAL